MTNNTAAQRESMQIVVVGHVDHGKSTVIGRLLADTNSLPQGKLDQVREKCRRNSKPFEYAFLLDTLKDEQQQGITIDSARCFFKTEKRRYIIIDAPGHVEFVKNMVTGASRAEAALLVIDASEGIRENSKRHAFLLSMLGIRQLCILINKMDLIGYQENVYADIVKQYTAFLNKINLTPQFFIPVSAIEGENITGISGKTGWYHGPTVLEALDIFKAEALPERKPFRMPVQGIYKFTKDGDTRRIIAGTIETGKISVGDEVIIYPSGKKSKVKSIEAFNSENKSAVTAGFAIGFTLEEQIYVKRGEIATLLNEPAPQVSTIIRAHIFWLGREALQLNKLYSLKLGTAKVGVTLERIEKVMNTSELEYVAKDQIDKYEVAECILKTDRAIAFDPVNDIVQTARFVLVDNYEISGGGIILEALDDRQVKVRKKVIARNEKWEMSLISAEERAERYNQKSALILITGDKKTERRALAKALEKRLFHEGKWVFYLGIGNVIYGVDSDIEGKNNSKTEHLRRFAEVAHLFLQAGAILITSAAQLSQNDLNTIKAIVDHDNIEVVWVGDNIAQGMSCDLQISGLTGNEEVVGEIKKLLQRKSIIFRPT